MNDIIFALMDAYSLNYGEARDMMIGACMGDPGALAAVVDVTPLGTID